MIVCHCNRIDHVDIEAACCKLEADGTWRVLTPGAVYQCLGKRVRCGGCMPLATSLIHGRRAGVAKAPTCCPLVADACPVGTSIAPLAGRDVTKTADVAAPS
jgi:hypothetical protein